VDGRGEAFSVPLLTEACFQIDSTRSGYGGSQELKRLKQMDLHRNGVYGNEVIPLRPSLKRRSFHRSQFWQILLFFAVLLIACNRSPESPLRSFTEAVQNLPPDKAKAFDQVTKKLQFKRNEIERFESSFSARDGDYTLLASDALIGPYNSETSPQQFILSMLALPGKQGHRPALSAMIPEILGPPAGIDVFGKPTWFTGDGAMLQVNEDYDFRYYSAPYTGDRLDQIEDSRLSHMPSESLIRNRLVARHSNEYPKETDLSYKGCASQLFTGAGLPELRNITLYTPTENAQQLSGIELVYQNFLQDPEWTGKALSVLSEVVPEALSVARRAVDEYVKSPRNGGIPVAVEGNFIATARGVDLGNLIVLTVWRRSDFRLELRAYMSSLPRWKKAFEGNEIDLREPRQRACHASTKGM
jgi:hypothetical protein